VQEARQSIIKIRKNYQDLLAIREKSFQEESTGLCAKHQRQVAVAIKRARVMALLPFVKS